MQFSEARKYVSALLMLVTENVKLTLLLGFKTAWPGLQHLLQL